MKELGLVVVMATLAFPIGRVMAEMEGPVPSLAPLEINHVVSDQLKTSDIELATYAIKLPDGGMCSAVAIAPQYLLTSDHCPRDKTGVAPVLHPVPEWTVPPEGIPIDIHNKDGKQFKGLIVASSLYAESALIKIDSASQWMEISTEVSPGEDIKSAGFPTEQQVYTVAEGIVIGDENCVDEWRPYVDECVGHTINTQPGWSGGGVSGLDGTLKGIIHGYEFKMGQTIGLMIPGDVLCKFLNEAIAESDRSEIDNCN